MHQEDTHYQEGRCQELGHDFRMPGVHGSQLEWTVQTAHGGLQEDDGEFPFPIQAKLGPYEAKDVIYGSKNYYWCTCGMSRKQPFCDKSHIGTSFQPLKF